MGLSLTLEIRWIHNPIPNSKPIPREGERWWWGAGDGWKYTECSRRMVFFFAFASFLNSCAQLKDSSKVKKVLPGFCRCTIRVVFPPLTMHFNLDFSTPLSVRTHNNVRNGQKQTKACNKTSDHSLARKSMTTARSIANNNVREFFFRPKGTRKTDGGRSRKNVNLS